MAFAMMRGQFADLRQPFAVVRAIITRNLQQIEERQLTHKHDEEDIDALRDAIRFCFYHFGAECGLH